MDLHGIYMDLPRKNRDFMGKKHHLWMEIGDSTNLKHDGDLMGDS